MQCVEHENPKVISGPRVAAATVDTLSSCPECDGSRLRSLPTPGHWIGGEVFSGLQGKLGLMQCRSCGLVFTNPRPSEQHLGAFYAGNTYVCHETAGSASAGAKANVLLERIERHLPAGAPRTVLDYGAGGGGFLLHARSRGWAAQGFEPGRRGLEACRASGLDVTADCDELASGAFGLVTLHHVFEHLANPAQTLRDMKRLLAPEGRLFIEVPNAGSLRARCAWPLLSRRHGVDERYRAFPIHLMYYTAGTLRNVLESGGWQVEAIFTLGLGMDEFKARNGSSSERATQPRPVVSVKAGSKRRMRHALRDAFLALGLGENLAVIARADA